MLAAQRRSAILDIVRSTGAAEFSELVSQFGVSAMTIRRDVELLAGRGLVVKVHGGAMVAVADGARATSVAGQPVTLRAEKEAIAAAAASLVPAGSTLALSPGTTTALLAWHIAAMPGLTVVTNSLPAASVLRRADQVERTLLLIGGTRTPSGALVGPVAEAAIAELNVDVCFVGVHGMSLRTGFTASDLLEAAVTRRLVASAQRVVVLADHSKWEKVGISRIATLDEADVLVTDNALRESAVAVLRERVGELVIASV